MKGQHDNLSDLKKMTEIGKIPLRKIHVPVYRFLRYRYTGPKNTSRPKRRYYKKLGFEDDPESKKREPVLRTDIFGRQHLVFPAGSLSPGSDGSDEPLGRLVWTSDTLWSGAL